MAERSPLNVQVSEETLQRIKRISTRTGTPEADVPDRAVRIYRALTEGKIVIENGKAVIRSSKDQQPPQE